MAAGAEPSRLATRLAELRAMGRLLLSARRALRPSAPWNASRLLQLWARSHPDGTGLVYGDRRYRWSELDREVQRTASALQAAGIGPGDVVALLMDNRPEFLLAVTALSRLRAVSALLNTHASGRALEHAIASGEPKLVLAGSEHAARLREVLPALAARGLGRERVLGWVDPETPVEHGFEDFGGRLDVAGSTLVDVGPPRVDERMCYIYTSGTTGLPKAAIVLNRRWLLAGAFFGAAVLELGPGDVVYIALPLYHSNAMYAGWGSALVTGAGMALRRRFSASRFWEDLGRYEATSFVYIGELCRYLLDQPERPEERSHRLRVITGNGLRPDIWRRFQARFGVPLIREFYGATEGNAPLVNLSGRVGMIGCLRGGQAVVRCDLETGEAIRGPDGRCERAGPGQTGLLIGRIGRTTSFEGYVDERETRKKILEGVFRPGDRWFDTGDLVRVHEHRWVSFADRVGDTFRWKGENVSTQEVAEILNGAPGVLESNVYGVEVPGAEGRAGMAALRCGEDFSLAAFTDYALAKLPVYQRPYFLRLLRDGMRVTSTFKQQKVDYRREGYDPARVADALYWLEGERYVPLDDALHEVLRAGRLTLR